MKCSPRKVDIKKIANVNMELQAASAKAKPDMERSMDSERQNVMSGLDLDHLKYGPDRYGYTTILNTQCLGTNLPYNILECNLQSLFLARNVR